MQKCAEQDTNLRNYFISYIGNVQNIELFWYFDWFFLMIYWRSDV